MEFNFSSEISTPRDVIWAVLIDVRRVAACIPGCEEVVELLRLSHYTAVLKQKLGPFRLEVPAEIHVEDICEYKHIRLNASGRDKFTGTTFAVKFAVLLEGANDSETTLTFDAALNVAGRLASLGYPVIRKQAEKNFTEFNERLRAEIVI